MNRNQNTHSHTPFSGETRKSFFHFLKNIFAVNRILTIDVTLCNNTYNEKLPIIYANIRVWILIETLPFFSIKINSATPWIQNIST